jgi:hypothetical protein
MSLPIIDDPRVVEKILHHLGARHNPPARPQADRVLAPTNHVTTWIQPPFACSVARHRWASIRGLSKIGRSYSDSAPPLATLRARWKT